MNNENNNEDTMYFGDNNPGTYENNNSYTEADMQDVYHPMTNTNSVEYDSDDYESNSLPEEENGKNKMIIAYVIAIGAIMLIIMVALFKLL